MPTLLEKRLAMALKQRQRLGLFLLIGTYVFWPMFPGWEPFNIVDFASIPLLVGSFMLLFHPSCGQ